MDFLTVIFCFLAFVVFLLTVATSVVITPENHYSFITLFGKYQKTVAGGLAFKIPFVTSVDKRVFLGLSSEKVSLSLKTKDQVTFKLNLNVQHVISSDAMEAFKAVYNIENYLEEISNIATNTAIPLANGIEIESVFNEKEKITEEVLKDLNEFFSEYGITIKRVLSDEPKLPKELEDQANDVMKAKRDQESATYIAEKVRIEKVGVAEADGESVKIRMEKLGESREGYAEKTANSVRHLIDVGCSADAALLFLNQIGEQDAIVSSSRNGSSVIFHTSNNGSNNSSSDAILAKMLTDGSNKLEKSNTLNISKSSKNKEDSKPDVSDVSDVSDIADIAIDIIEKI